jgi:hypothetical protein
MCGSEQLRIEADDDERRKHASVGITHSTFALIAL